MLAFLFSSTFLQWWGGGFYLLNKVFFSFKERTQETWNRRWHISAWAVYLIGLPAWLAVFAFNNNWIAVGVECGGSLSMLLGLVNAARGQYEKHKKQKKWQRRLRWAAFCTVLIGLGFSIYGFGGIYLQKQWLELGLATGFLGGTFLLAADESDKSTLLAGNKSVGYLFFILMLVSNARLQWIQGYSGLMAQQLISIPFIVDAYVTDKGGWRLA